MHGYRDHCIRKTYSVAPFYCPYSMYQFTCPYCEYRQKAEEYPALHHKRPQSPPPNYIPKMPALVGSVESSAITPCINKFTYLWLTNGESFWTYIIYVGKKAVLGWRYIGGRWVQFHSRLRQIKNFVCP